MNGRFSSGQLKITAMATMFIDHAAAAMLYNTGLNMESPLLEDIGIAMRLVGRMAFPLYAFLLVQGFMWTSSWKNYVKRVAGFALLSEIPYNLMIAGELWHPAAQNTIMTLLTALTAIKMLETLEKRYDLRHGRPEEHLIGIVLCIWVIVMAMLAAECLRTDYGALGVLLVLVFYVFRHRPMEQIGAGCLVLALIYQLGITVLFAWIAIFLISRYNGERGWKSGMIAYWFYPAHLLAVWLLGELCQAVFC